jgi:hemolysin activation/secretion protein
MRIRLFWLSFFITFAVSAAFALEQSPATPPAATVVAAEPIPRFAITHFRVEGNSILAEAEVSALLRQFAGPDKDFGDVQQALDALENAYRHKGYNSVSVYLPEQELKGGVITFRVVEAKISGVDIEGNRFFTKENIEQSFPSLVSGTFPRVHEISKNLRAVNENPAKKVSLQLLSGGREDEIIARLKVVDEKYWKTGLTFDNSGNRQTGDYRFGILLQHFNLFNRDHVATVHYTTSPDHAERVNSISGSYRLPLYRLGDTIDVFAGYSDIDSGVFSVTTNTFSYTASNINGKGVIGGARYNYTLKRFGEYSQKLVAGMDYRYYDNSSRFDVSLTGGSSFDGSSKTELVLHPLSLSYLGSYAMENGETGLYLGAAYNPPWGEHGGRKDFPEGTAADYFVLRYGAFLAHLLPADFQVRFSFNGQYAPRNLVVYEQMGLGGAGFGRGYGERAAEGDVGYAGTAEIYSPDLARMAAIADSQLRLVAFYDDGYVRRATLEQGDDAGARASSVGGGARLSLSRYFTASVDWGVTLTSLPSFPRGNSRIHFKAAIIY